LCFIIRRGRQCLREILRICGSVKSLNYAFHLLKVARARTSTSELVMGTRVKILLLKKHTMAIPREILNHCRKIPYADVNYSVDTIGSLSVAPS